MMAMDLIKDGSDVKFARLLFNKGTDDALSFNCLIKEITDDYIDFVGISNYAEQVQEGAPVDVRIYSSIGIVGAEATLLKTYRVDGSICYKTTYPTPYEHTQKRAYYRADMHLPVTLLIMLPNGQVRQVNATTKNISGRGMCFVSVEKEFPEYYSITANITFPRKQIVTTADFVYTTKVKYNDVALYIHAFKFMGIEPEDINFIVKECVMFQINQKKMI